MNNHLRVFHDAPNQSYFATVEIQWLLVGKEKFLVQRWKSHKKRYEPVWVIVPTVEVNFKDDQPHSAE